LKEIAKDMGQELNKQNDMLAEIENKVDKAQEHLDNVNVKMKNMLEKVHQKIVFLHVLALFVDEGASVGDEG
jgi:hypothetical protein